MLKKYDILELDIKDKYTHPALVWYQKKHMFLLDGGKEEDFKVPMPGKNVKETIKNKQKVIKAKLSQSIASASS